ncbi:MULTISPECIES: hypothetical protein [unclassified Tolypothrix]|nr:MULTISPECIES: hypothetical protein [unclassified Tolypothrix]BAY88669.1 hypothetical protein NIES3275_06470 [Microchaete diplosiphon NIES-3275]EKF00476.1 hypothetical protein FDUTEX481_08908 [Tolypothrix sp. PCC 7601]MBE9086752.1 hypothetical protein [Tolypothrix sp. LEGE 11397]UYD29339.1 hypothetical protein HGR01_15620 [Tolypothrix sp. PCC 7712]UYD34754.1 hypothetical protein HG267_02720 [Tolypothrix sp. PCC 7601]
MIYELTLQTKYVVVAKTHLSQWFVDAIAPEQYFLVHNKGRLPLANSD